MLNKGMPESTRILEQPVRITGVNVREMVSDHNRVEMKDADGIETETCAEWSYRCSHQGRINCLDQHVKGRSSDIFELNRVPGSSDMYLIKSYVYGSYLSWKHVNTSEPFSTLSSSDAPGVTEHWKILLNEKFYDYGRETDDDSQFGQGLSFWTPDEQRVLTRKGIALVLPWNAPELYTDFGITYTPQMFMSSRNTWLKVLGAWEKHGERTRDLRFYDFLFDVHSVENPPTRRTRSKTSDESDETEARARAADCAPKYRHELLTSDQQKALGFVRDKAIHKSLFFRDELRATINQMAETGRIENAIPRQRILTELHRYFETEVPLIIHTSVDNIPHYLKDVAYRSLFEVGKGYGCVDKKIRASFEAKMFDRAYTEETMVSTRPTYGCLNIGRSSQGDQVASHHYGEAFFVLRDETVRWRTTMTIEDSFHNPDTATLKHCDYLLAQLPDRELQQIIDAARTKNCSKRISADTSYREIQIHGQVLFQRDIVSLNVPKRWNVDERDYVKGMTSSEIKHYLKASSMREVMERFQKKNGFELIFF